jgi:hypothetical protein
MFVNPYGWRLPASCLDLLQSKVVPMYVDEHKPLDAMNVWQRWILVVGVLYLGALSNVDWRRWRVTWLLPMVWLVLAIRSARHGPLFSITALFGFAEVLPHTRAAQWLASAGSWLYSPPEKPPVRDWRPWALPVAAVLACLGVEAAGVRGWAQFDAELVPLTLVPKLQEYEREHPGAPILNDLYYGGFLIYKTPNLRIFIDDRCELYGDDRIREYAEEFIGETGHDPSRIAGWIKEYDIRLALVEKYKPGDVGRAGLDQYLANNAEWKKIAETDGAVLYERVGK